MSVITLEQMSSTLLSIDQVVEQLEKTEPLTSITLDSTKKISFALGNDVMDGINGIAPTGIVDAQITIDGVESALSKDALFQAAANYGLSSAYIRKIPPALTARLLNFHYGAGMTDESFKLLKVKDTAAAFTREKVVPFSNLKLLESVVTEVESRDGSAQIFADYKFNNTLRQTDIRLILTEDSWHMDTDMSDVPAGETDAWYAGVHISNSVIGKAQTRVEPYLFRWWCTNGATTHVGLPAWNRKKDGQADDVYEWAANTVDSLFGHYNELFAKIQALNSLDITGNTADILREIFESYGVPVSQRNSIMNSLLAANPITMYTVMAAITQAANDPDLAPDRADKLMRIGGAIPSTTFDTLKAKIWREGHLADSDVNPYEPAVV